jgi:transketolase
MRDAFAKTLQELARENDSIVLLMADIGNRMFNNYKNEFPTRFYNCGIAEANMTGVAAGMALNGLKPFTYTIASFNSLRNYEQIKIDIAYQNLPVVIVGVGSGLSYAPLNPTHQSCEDLAIMKVLPNMTVLAPADSMELSALLRECISYNSPVYIRIGKKHEPILYDNEPDLRIGKAHVYRSGKNVCIINTGITMPICIKAANYLDAELISMHTIKPLDKKSLERIFNQFDLVISVEEHSIIGGLGSSIADWIIDSNIKCKAKFRRIALPDRFLDRTGSAENIRKKMGLTAENIVQIANSET